MTEDRVWEPMVQQVQESFHTLTLEVFVDGLSFSFQYHFVCFSCISIVAFLEVKTSSQPITTAHCHHEFYEKEVSIS